MTSTLVSLGPVVAGFVVGYALRRSRLATVNDGSFLLLLNLYVCMPALSLRSLTTVEMTPRLAVFPLAAAVMVVVGYLVGRVLLRVHRSPASERGVRLMSLMVVNSAFALPFVDALYGDAGVARLVAFDAVNGVLVLTLVFATAASHNPRGRDPRRTLGKVAGNPALYAVAAGLVMNTADVGIPSALGPVIDVFAAASPFLITVGTGLLFRPARALLARASVVAVTRLLVGLTTALIVAWVAGMDGVDLGVLLYLGIAPIGFVTVTFASMEHLDTDLAVQALTVSLLTSFILAVTLGAAIG